MDPISDLLEIAGEDDSLLSGGNGSSSANIFSCSPLVSIRSRPLQTAQPVEGIETTSVVSEDLTSSPKVSQQSQQKKRKKKFGGFNLRKSLAWDRAFFTEQGVLNPTELSMISGTATPNSKSNLEVIDEEELATTSTALQEIEENLFKHSSIRGKKIGAVSGLSPKPGASVKRTPPIASLAKRKVLSSNNVGNKYKRGAIPRAVPSSSTDSAKTPSEESKITRIPGQKSNVSANATSTRSGMLSSSSLKRNQNAHPGMSKNPMPSIPSLSKNPTPSIPRLSKTPTPSIPSLSKNHTPSIPRLSKNPTPSLPSLSKNPTYVPSIPKVDMADKSSVSRTLTKQAGKLSDNSISVPRPPSSMHQTGTIKSSGLRKPSPSIGFFSQVKASSSHSLQKSSIPCKPSESNIPKLRKLETVSVKEARSKIVKGTSKNTKELSLSGVKSEAIVQIDNKQMASVEVECDSSSFEIISKQAEVENILDDVILKSQEQGELHENKIISSMENMALPTLRKEFLTKSQTHEQLEKEADHTLDNKLYDVSSNGDGSLYQEPQSMLNPIIQRTSNNVQNAIGQDEDDQIKGPTGDIPTFKESLILQEEHRTSFKDGRHSGEFKEDNIVKSEAIIMQIDNKQMAGVEVECDSSSFETISKQAEVENILDGVILKSQEQGELHENKIISSMENMALPTHGKEFLTKSQTHEQSEKEADHALDNKLYDVSSNGDGSLYQEPQSTLNPIIQRTSNTVQNAIGQDEDDQIKGPTGDIPTFRESLILQEEHRTSFKDGKHSGEFKEDNSVKTTLINSSLDGFSIVPEGSKQGTPCKNTELGNNGADEFSKYEGDAQGHLLIESLTPICKKPTQSNLEAVSQQLQADQPKTLNPSGVEENGPEKENLSDMNRSQPVHVTTLFSKCSPEKFILGINGASEDESKIIEIKLPVDDQSGFIPRSPLDKECDQAIDSKAIHDRTSELELDRLSEDCITVSASSMAYGNNINEDSHLPGFQKASAVATVNTQDVHLDSDFLPTVIVSSTELKDQNLVEDAFEGRGFHSNEHNSTNHHIEDMLVNIDGNHDVDGKVELLQINDAIENVEFLQINVMDEKVELLQINDVDEKVQINDVDEKVQINDVDDRNHDVDEKVEVLQINGNRDVSEKVELLQINDVDEKVELLQINDVDENVELLQINDVNEKVEFSQINDVEDGNHDVDEKVELLQINGAEDGNPGVDEKGELLQINDVEDGNHDVDEKAELLQISNVEDGNCDVDEKVELLQINDVDEKGELLQINGAKDGNSDVDEKLEFLQINVVDEKVKLLQINNAEDGNHDVDEKVELVQISGAEDGTHDVDEKVEFLQINDVSEKVELLQINNVDEKEELLQINDVEDGNHDVYEKVELLQINGAEDGNRDVDEKVELFQIIDAEERLSDILPLVETQLNENFFSAEFDSSEVSGDPLTTPVSLKSILSEKSKLLNSDLLVNKDGNQDIDEKVELLLINGAEEGSLDISPSVEIQLENVISAEFDSSTEVSEDPCCLSSEKLKLLASENSIFNATIPQGSEVSSVKLNENAISAELDSSIEVIEGPFTSVVAWKPEEQCLLSENSKILASDNPTLIETIPQGNEVSSANSESFSNVAVTTVFENDKSPNTEMLSQTKDNNDFLEGSEVSSMKLNENAISAESYSSIEVSEGPCLLSEKLKLLASENSIFNATIPQHSKVCSMKHNENAIPAELDSSIEMTEGPFISVVAWKPEEHCPLSESKLLASDNPTFIETIPQGNEASSMNSERFSDVAVTTVFENDMSPNTDMPSQTKDNIDFLEDNSKTIPQGNEASSMNSERFSDVAVTTVFENDKSPDTDIPSQTKDNIDFPEDNIKIIHLEVDASKTQQEVPIAKPALNVAPFTEEWLAAIEAAGEEILTMKSGAVQNSPPDKVQNEPNPWSPVKKNQEIGPFDCTKITKLNIQSSDPS